MSSAMPFHEALDAVAHLPLDQQAELVAVVQRRLAQQGRERIVDDVAEARVEYAAGKAAPTNVENLMGEIDAEEDKHAESQQGATDSIGWRAAYGTVPKDVADEVQRIIDEEFSRVDPEGWD